MEKMRQHFFVWRRFFCFALHFSLELVERNKLVDLGRPSAAIHLEMAQNDCALSILLEKNERIAGPEFRRVKHVRIDVAWRDNEASIGLRFSHTAPQLSAKRTACQLKQRIVTTDVSYR